MRPDANALRSVLTIASWPMRSSKVCGRYLRASTTYGFAAPAAGRVSLSDFFFAMSLP